MLERGSPNSAEAARLLASSQPPTLETSSSTFHLQIVPGWEQTNLSSASFIYSALSKGGAIALKIWGLRILIVVIVAFILPDAGWTAGWPC